MAGEQERKRRAALVTKALLLGYTIAWDEVTGGYGLWRPDGRRVRVSEHSKTRAGHTIAWHVPDWPAVWLAAQEALKLSGVPDAKDIPRDTGTGSGKNWKVRHRRGLRGGSKSLFESDGSP